MGWRGTYSFFIIEGSTSVGSYDSISWLCSSPSALASSSEPGEDAVAMRRLDTASGVNAKPCALDRACTLRDMPTVPAGLCGAAPHRAREAAPAAAHASQGGLPRRSKHVATRRIAISIYVNLFSSPLLLVTAVPGLRHGTTPPRTDQSGAALAYICIINNYARQHCPGV